MDLAAQCFEDALTQCPSYISLQEDIGGKFVGMKMSEKVTVRAHEVKIGNGAQNCSTIHTSLETYLAENVLE